MAQEEGRPYLTTGQRIRWLMERDGLKRRDVWPRSGASESAFYLYAYDRRDIPGPVAAKLAVLFNTTSDFILGLTDDPRAYSGDSAKASSLSLPHLGDSLVALPA